jgi:hypothetical protein
MSGRQEGAWRGLLDVAPLLPERSWCVIGGQMVFLYCCEREVAVNRPTDDGDVALDVRARPEILHDFTAALKDVGFDSAGVSPEGHQHRWVRGEAQIDVLIPTRLGKRAAKRSGVTGGTTLATPAAQQALDRSAPVLVEIDGASGTVWRPSMIGALVAKAAAYSVQDAARDRHLVDFAVLASMVSRSDSIADQVTRRDRQYLYPLLSALGENRSLWVMIEDAERGIDVLGGAVG